MNTRLSRRNLMLLAGSGALSAGLASAVTSHAQTTASTFTFLNGSLLTANDPWQIYDENLVAAVVPDSAALRGGKMGEVALGFYDAPQSMDDVATALLTFVLGDASLAQGISGGGRKSVQPGGAESSLDFRLYNLTVGDAGMGLYIQLVNGVEVGLLGAPVADFAAEMASAQESIQIDGVGVFGGAIAADLQETLEDWNRDASSGEYTDGTGFLHVTWTEPWTELARNEDGIQLTNQDASAGLYIARYPTEGKSWEELAEIDISFLYGDQGPDAKLVGSTVTDPGFSFVTDGKFGLRFAQGSATDSPDTYVLTFAADFAADIDIADAAELVQDAQANVQINGVPALQGLEELI
jgi:hypothetical protein